MSETDSQREDYDTEAEAEDDPNWLLGMGAVALFALLAIVFVRARFGPAQGFPEGASIVEAIGYAMFNLEGGAVPSAGFLAAFEIIDLVLVAALVGSVMLARRDDEGEGMLSEIDHQDLSRGEDD
jgi:NADH-quinone oxidoreductase subunit J